MSLTVDEYRQMVNCLALMSGWIREAFEAYLRIVEAG